MVKTLHAAGIEVIIDVVYNHTAEGEGTELRVDLRGVWGKRVKAGREGSGSRVGCEWACRRGLNFGTQPHTHACPLSLHPTLVVDTQT